MCQLQRSIGLVSEYVTFLALECLEMSYKSLQSCSNTEKSITLCDGEFNLVAPPLQLPGKHPLRERGGRAANIT